MSTMTNPIESSQTITASDSAVFSPASRAVMVDVSGAVAVVYPGGQTDTLTH